MNEFVSNKSEHNNNFKMKVKVSIKILPNGQGKSDKERDLQKTIDLPNPEEQEEVRIDEILKNWDDKTRRELFDNRMVSYFNKTHQAFINIGNFWIERPPHAHKDIPDAKLALVKTSDIVNEGDTI